MADIISLGHPLVYKASIGDAPPSGLAVEDDNIAVRAEVRALTGMQKEALVYYGPSGTTWRMVSDEGPYLKGSDLAPFPLGFFASGMAFSFTDELLKHAKAAGITITNYCLRQDTFYTIKGSALRGNMISGARPVKMRVEIESDADEAAIERLVAMAEKTSPAQVVMEEQLISTFALTHNGVETAVANVSSSAQPIGTVPTAYLEAARPLDAGSYEPDIIRKLVETESLVGVEGGVGSSLTATQKRGLHLHAVCTLLEDGLKEVKVQALKPLGSTFRFIGDDTPQERAPASLAYLAAGVSFCFMTQIGRYAQIVKQKLQGYHVVQDAVYRITADSAEADSVDTHAFLQSGEEDDAAQRTLYMSERTCFLHAALRESNRSEISVVLNGNLLHRSA